MAKTRRKYKGNATSTTLATSFSAGATSVSVAAATGWPTSGPFYAVIDAGTSSEEKILVGSISGTSLSSITRGVDDTTDQTHSSGATIYPVFTAVDADEANELASTWTTKGDLVAHGASTFVRVAAGTNNHVLMADSAQASGLKYALVGENNLASDAVTTAKILDGAVTSAKIADGTIVDADVNASAAIALSKLATGALPSGITVSSANLVDLTIATADIADSAVTSAKIADATIVNGDISASAAITLSKLVSAAAGQVIVHDGSGVPTATTISGDATVSSSGVVTIANDAVTTAKIQNGQVTAAKFASGLAPVYTDTTTPASPSDGMVAYVNSGDIAEGIQTYNGTAWRKSWNMPWGVISTAQATASQTNITTTEDVTDVTTGAITYVANRMLRITIQASKLSSSDVANAPRADIFLTDGANTVIQTATATLVANNRGQSVALTAYVSTGAGGSVTYKARINRGIGTSGTISTNASSTNPFQIIVEDIGPSGVPA